MSCGNHDSVVGPISWRGNCEQCGLERARQAAMELHLKKGPMFRRWYHNRNAGIERAVLDAASNRP